MEDTNLLNGVEPEGTEEVKEEPKEDEVKIPEGLDPSFWDEEKKSIKQEDLIKAYDQEKKKALGLRQKLSEKGNYKPPKDVSEYTLPEDETLNSVLGKDSKALEIMKSTALESNLTTAQFNDFVSKMIPQLIESGALKVDKPLNEEEQKAQFEKYKQAELEKLGPDGNRVIASVKNWGKGMVNRGVLSKDELSTFEAFASDAGSIKVLNKIMALTGEPSIPVRASSVEGLPSEEEIKSIIASKEYQDGDFKAHKKVKDYYQTVYKE